jgi:Kef-type K+ transport system membrane component KefB
MSSSVVSSEEMAAVKTSSNGVWQGDDPLHFAFPLLILQALLILVLSRLLAFLLRPLRQPKVIAEIVAGILLGPSALGRNKAYLRALFPPWSAPVLESVASLGLLFFLFLVGLELDLRSVRRSGRRAFAIAAAGISLPFACGVGVAFVLRAAVPGADQAGYAPFLVFMGVALSITAFPVMARILAELKLLTTPIGETALAAAAFNDVAAWVLLALAVAISGSGDAAGTSQQQQHRSPVVSVWVLLCGAAFVAAWMVAVKPAMAWVARRADAAGDSSEAWVAVTLAGVLASGFATDVIGIHAIFGAFVFGLTVPKEGGFAARVTARVEDIVSELLLPLYFASSGLKTDVATVRGGEAWAMLALVIGTACAGKIVGTFGVAMVCGMGAREALVLGVVMNTKGLVELIVLNIGRERKVRSRPSTSPYIARRTICFATWYGHVSKTILHAISSVHVFKKTFATLVVRCDVCFCWLFFFFFLIKILTKKGDGTLPCMDTVERMNASSQKRSHVRTLVKQRSPGSRRPLVLN